MNCNRPSGPMFSALFFGIKKGFRKLKPFLLFGDRAGVRTQDPLLKREMLYQLSYQVIQMRRQIYDSLFLWQVHFCNFFLLLLYRVEFLSFSFFCGVKIFLIGLSGVGKSSLGGKLAKQLGLNFIDLDNYIEKQANKSIHDIFNDEGESSFRVLEKKALEELIELENIAVACGGGTPCFNNQMKLMLDSGIVIHLTLPVKVIVERLNKSYNRPLLSSVNEDELLMKIESQWKARKEYYRQAQIEADVFNWNAEKMNLLKQKVLDYTR